MRFVQQLKTLSLAILLAGSTVRGSVPAPAPDEGMWLVNVITGMNIAEMRKLGFELSAEDIYSLNSPSLKDAIMSFGGFCTGEFVSAKGLVFTNHHCGYDAIAGVSTTESNHLDNGFWAASYKEEIPIPDLFVDLLVKADNISDSILPAIAGLDEAARGLKVREIIDRIVAAEEASTGLLVEIKAMYGGNQYFIFYHQRYNDVRLVGTPPQSIGKYGGDTDNWMWPRHTGDFSVFRVYADGNNQPAAYSETNRPYEPKRYLKVDISGLKEGDPTMIMGYPGSTNRYLTSYAMKEVINETNPAQIDMFRAVTDAMKIEMDKDDAIRLQLSPDYASYMNVLKLYTGQVEGMTKVMDAVAVKEAEEKAFTTWLNKQDSETKSKYGNLLTEYANTYAALSAINKAFYYKRYAVILPSTANIALTLQALEPLLADKKTSSSDKEAVITEIKAVGSESFPYMYGDLEKNTVVSMLKVMNNKLSDEQKPQSLKNILTSAQGLNADEKIQNWANNAFSTSLLTSETRLNAFLSKPKLKTLQSDELYRLFTNLNEESMELLGPFRENRRALNKLNRDYIAATMAMQPNRAFYPDANFSMRLTYGKVWDYSPKDAVNFHWQTYMEGIVEKMDNNSEEFTVPADLYALYKNGNFGRYADETGDVPVCFLSDNDITGGNSGSPIMNGRGELIGLAFDGNYEGTPGDYVFDPNMNRTINVDIRYVLFIIDKMANCQHIMRELDIIE